MTIAGKGAAAKRSSKLIGIRSQASSFRYTPQVSGGGVKTPDIASPQPLVLEALNRHCKDGGQLTRKVWGQMEARTNQARKASILGLIRYRYCDRAAYSR